MNEQKFYIQAKVQKIDKNIEKAIKQAGIVYPHPSLSFFLAKYALADGKTPNLNNVILEKSVQEDVPLLIGCQVNKNHIGFLRLGYIPYAFMVGDEIQIVICFDRTYNQKDYDEAIKLLDAGKLHVSFELMVKKADVQIDGKNQRLKHASFCGVGLLFDVNPAYPEGDVIQKAMEIITETLSKSEDKQLIYANVESISKKWLALGEQIETIINEKAINDKQDINKEETIVDNKVNEQLLAKFKADLIAEKGDEVKDWTDEQFASELEKRASEDKPKEAKIEADKVGPKGPIGAKGGSEEKDDVGKVVKEVKADEVSPEPVKEEAQKVNEKTTETRVYDVTRDDEKGTMEVVETTTSNVEVDGKIVMEEKKVRNTVYTQATIDAMKADYEAKIAEKDTIIADKDNEIKAKDEAIVAKDSQVKLIKENAKLIVTKRDELGEFAKDLSDEDLIADNDKVKIAELKKENDVLKKAKAPDTVVTAEKKDEKVILEASANGDNAEVQPEVRRKVMKIRTSQKV